MKQTTPTQKGLLTGTLMILASLFSLYVLKDPVESYFQYVVYTIFTAGIVWSLISYSKSATDKKSFSNYFSPAIVLFCTERMAQSWVNDNNLASGQTACFRIETLGLSVIRWAK